MASAAVMCRAPHLLERVNTHGRPCSFLSVPEAGTRSHARGLYISTGFVLVLFLYKALCAPFSEILVREIGRNTPLKHLEEIGEDQERK